MMCDKFGEITQSGKVGLRQTAALNKKVSHTFVVGLIQDNQYYDEHLAEVNAAGANKPARNGTDF